jgi:hypothetical protein
MFVDSADEIVRYAEIESSVFATGKEIDVIHQTPGVWIPGPPLSGVPE